jgi:thiol-disulfide isomerase/thioredoxin
MSTAARPRTKNALLAMFSTFMLICIAVLLERGSEAGAKEKDASAQPFARRLKVEPFPEGVPWINTTAPIKLADLQGKFVLLDFWTLGCINCMHIIPELQKLEAAYPKQLVVIGVHSAKFTSEKDTANITDAAHRYRIEHPVINDSDFIIWNRFGVRAWPSLVLIDPEGYAVWAKSGEITFDDVDSLLRKGIPYYRSKKLLNEKPLRFGPSTEQLSQTPLRFPGKILADEAAGRLFIADSNHNRIVVTRLDGSLLETIGAGTVGRADGPYKAAQFNQPQGMALQGEMLYVADTGNHLIRKVDLAGKEVSTIAGVGHQRREPAPLGRSEEPRKAALNSPWDVCIHKGDLYIAMAGAHQIWKMRLEEGSSIGVYAGNGSEDIVDGPLAPRRAYQDGFSAFAQPSGLTADGHWLYVADAEGSSIRAVPFDAKKQVTTVVGTAHLAAARLFTFGDADGPAKTAQLQHPLAVVFYEGLLYVADTYNHKVKAIDPADGSVRTVAGTGKAGRSDDPPAFDAPAGISAAAGKLYVADTNNHLIRVIDLRRQNKVTTLPLSGL